MTAPDWINNEVSDGYVRLTDPQVDRLMRMVEVLRDPINLKQVAEIKENINVESGDVVFCNNCHEYARSLFSEFTDDEQQKLWIAPTKGGIFTTYERKILQGENA